MKIDVTSLAKALEQLEKSRSFLRSEMAEKNRDLYEQFRAACVQAFEFTYELSIKMLRRRLDQIVANPAELRQMAFMDFIRTAYEAGLVRDVANFRVYREMRNITSHTYDSDKAEEVVRVLDSFVTDVRYILNEIEERNQ